MEQLATMSLLTDQHPRVITDYPCWEEFFEYFSIPYVQPLSITEYSQQWMVLQAASEGEGVALVKRSLVKQDILKGSLVQIGKNEIKLETGYHLVYPEQLRNDPIVTAFENWILHCVAE